MEAINRPSSRLDAGLNRPSVRPLSAPTRPIKLTIEPSFPPSVHEPSSITPQFSIFRARWTLRTCAKRSPGNTAVVGALSPYFSSCFGRNRAHRCFLPSPPRSWPRRSEPSWTLRPSPTEPRYPLDAPRTFNHELGRSNTESEALRGRGNGATVGLSSRRASRLFFVPYRVCLVVLVTMVVFFLFGVAGNVIPASSEEFTSSAAMAPPRSASAQASTPTSFLPGPSNRFPTTQIAYPFGVA